MAQSLPSHALMNDQDRFHLVSDVIDRVPKLGYLAAYVKQAMRDKQIEHKEYIKKHAEDMPEIREWRLTGARTVGYHAIGLQICR